jgi:SOS-response transcriptional repressor LexA
MKVKYNEFLGNKLKEIRENKNLTLDEFSLLLNEDRQTYYNYERGSRGLHIFKLEKYVKKLKLSHKEILEILNISLNNNLINSIDGFLKANIYSFAGAGNFIDLTEYEPIDTIIIPVNFYSPSIVLVKVSGHSMEPLIFNDAIVGIDKNDKQFVSGEIYAVWLPYEGAVIKRLYVMKDNIILSSENKNFPEIKVSFADVQADNFIIGRLKWVIQKF